MIKANFNTYNNYVTDSLYQWDLNQDLIINGLNLSVAPEIHFANGNMDRAIVRQSTLSSGVVTVSIPNSLLQEALTIKAYVGVYEDDTFKVIETIEIPVIAKTRPSDYALTDTDEEIYSFNKLENEIANAKKNIADQCDDNLVAMKASIAKETKTLSAQVANIVAHNNDTDSNTELLDMRVDYEGNTHTSAGEAVRYQTGKLSSENAELKSDIVCVNNIIGSLKDKLVIVGRTLGEELREFPDNPKRAFVPFLRSGCTISAISGKIALVYDNYSDIVRKYISQDGSFSSEASFYSSITIPETLKGNGVVLYIIYKKSDDSIVSEEDVRNNVIITNGSHEGIVIDDGFTYYLTSPEYKLFFYPDQNRAVLNGHLPESIRYVNARNGYQFLLINEQGEYINSHGNEGLEWMSSVDIYLIRQNYQGKIFMQFKKGDGNEPVSGTQNNIDFLSNNTDRIMSVVVAASNSVDYDKKRADFVCSGVNDEVMIQAAVDSLKYGGTVYLANGDYNIDGWNHKDEITNNTTYTAFFAIGVTDRNQQTISIKGYTPPMRKVDAKDIVSTAVLHITPTAMDYINDDTYVGNVIGYVGVGENDRKYPKFALEIENLGIQMIDNQHAVRGINAELFSSCRIKNVMIAVDSTGGTDDTSGYQIPNDTCTGIRGLGGSNMGTGYIIEQCFVWGMGVAYDINGEHLVMTQCGCRYCNVPYRFGFNNKTGVNCHDLTLINCCHEGCINGIVFASNYSSQSINLYDYNMEILSSGKFAQVKKATESTPGNGRGVIRYTVSGDASNYNCYDDSFFEVGHGHNFDCVCSTSKRIGNTDEKPVASNYGNRFFDIKTGKDNIYLSDGWHEI